MRWAAGIVLSASLAACGRSEGVTLRVFAAASLADAFRELAAAYEDANPGETVELNFAASSALAAHIEEGAPADVFASADLTNMAKVTAAGAVFTRNQLVIAVPAGNPGGVAGLADLARSELAVGLCAEEVPCGRLAREALTNAGVTPALDTTEPDVRALLTKLEADELDAGIVYATDVLAAGDTVDGIAIPDEHNVVASYAIAPIAASDAGDDAAGFVEFVLGDDGQAILARYGFLPRR